MEREKEEEHSLLKVECGVEGVRLLLLSSMFLEKYSVAHLHNLREFA